jgi:hypothetical protein
VKPILLGYALGYLIVAGGSLSVALCREIRFHLAYRRFLREVSKMKEGQEDVMW